MMFNMFKADVKTISHVGDAIPREQIIGIDQAALPPYETAFPLVSFTHYLPATAPMTHYEIQIAQPQTGWNKLAKRARTLINPHLCLKAKEQVLSYLVEPQPDNQYKVIGPAQKQTQLTYA